ncbi:tRNA (guanine-N(7)-)-methyltransferase (tRNA(m7G46)-methyltransferase) [Tritrichomonas musculus]|uniref:tRNA (guanine-N(7)-)-methyltransferase n=1 Tax=Tritrichomonas musculus TaxID=1915356 RepID=A0ABR2K972_9EUKA
MTEEEKIKAPKKRDYRQRAHCNPLSDRLIPFPLNPSEIDWSDFYPILNTEEGQKIVDKTPSILDIGCGYGGMSFALGELFPEKLILGLEIRCVASSFVHDKVVAYRSTGKAKNVAVQWANTMRTLMRYIEPHSVDKIFVLFPDPHFKKRKMKWRIISPQLMDEYAYIMKENSRFYLVTDVKDYFDYAVPIIEHHPLFQKMETVESMKDKCLQAALTSTEESKKVDRNNGDKYSALFVRVSNK